MKSKLADFKEELEFSSKTITETKAMIKEGKENLGHTEERLRMIHKRRWKRAKEKSVQRKDETQKTEAPIKRIVFLKMRKENITKKH